MYHSILRKFMSDERLNYAVPASKYYLVQSTSFYKYHFGMRKRKACSVVSYGDLNFTLLKENLILQLQA